MQYAFFKNSVSGQKYGNMDIYMCMALNKVPAIDQSDCEISFYYSLIVCKDKCMSEMPTPACQQINVTYMYCLF